MPKNTPIIIVSSDVMGKIPVFADNRFPIQNLFDYLKEREQIDDFLDRFPTVTRVHVIGLLEEAGEIG
jgi:uncharacterized protein (DUF433 family)